MNKSSRNVMLQIKKLADFRRFGCLREHLVIRLLSRYFKSIKHVSAFTFYFKQNFKFGWAFLLLEY